MTRKWFAATCCGAVVLFAGCRNDSSPSNPDKAQAQPNEAQAQPKVDREKLIGTWTGPDPRGGNYKQLELKFLEDGTGMMRTEVQSSRINGTISEGVKYKIDPASTQVRIEYGGDVGVSSGRVGATFVYNSEQQSVEGNLLAEEPAMTAPVPTPATPEQQRLAAAVAADLQDQAAPILQQVADLLATVPEAQLFGDTEFLIRDHILQLVARSYQARLAQKKTATSAAVSTVPTADTPPPSTTTANETP